MGSGFSWHGRGVMLRNAPEPPARFKAKPKPRPNKKKSWRMGYRYDGVSCLSEWSYQAYANEKGARQAFEAKRHERNLGPSEHRLVNPAGEIVDSYKRSEVT